jgi:hypothetical protein
MVTLSANSPGPRAPTPRSTSDFIEGNRILVMRRGRIVGTYDPNRISEEERREAIYA